MYLIWGCYEYCFPFQNRCTYHRLCFSFLLPQYSNTRFTYRSFMVHRTNLELEQVDKVARKLSSPRKSCFGEYSDATVCETLTMKGLWRSLKFLYLGSILSFLSKRNSCSKRLKELGCQFLTNVNYYCEAFDVSHNDGHFLPLLSLFRTLFRSTHACFPVSFPNTCGSFVVCVVRSDWYWRPQRVVFQVRFKRVSL